MRNGYRHFKERTLERYNLKIDFEDYLKTDKLIRSNQAIQYYVCKLSNNKRIYRIPIKGVVVTVGYHKKYGILTALPK